MLTATLLLASLLLAWLTQLDVAGLRSRTRGYAILWPQQWSFFTNLDGDVVVVYRITADGSQLVPLDGDRLWGLSRAGDARAGVVRQVARGVPDRFWQLCARWTTESCGNDLNTELSYRVENELSDPGLCGPLALTVERTAPLASRSLPERPRRVLRIALVNLVCAK